MRAQVIKARLGRALAKVQAWSEQDRLDRLERDGLLTVGRYTYGRPRVDVYRGSEARTEIGPFCSIGPGVRIVTGGVHPTELVSTFPLKARMLERAGRDELTTTRGDVVIGPDVWIGSDVLVLSGVTVGPGAVIASGAVVANDIDPYSIVAGVPARTVRLRFSPEQIEALLRIRWWDWPDAAIADAVPLLNGSDVDELIRRHDQQTAADPSEA